MAEFGCAVESSAVPVPLFGGFEAFFFAQKKRIENFYFARSGKVAMCVAAFLFFVIFCFARSEKGGSGLCFSVFRDFLFCEV